MGAADALEKARFHSVQDESFLGDTKDLEVKIEHDPDAKTISIIDTGIGMTKADLINNLGTVAKSGTTNFLEAMAEGGDANLIGRFPGPMHWLGWAALAGQAGWAALAGQAG